jgi:hypothetical protein
LGLTFNNAVSSLAILNNELYVGGAFTLVNGIPVNRIMKLTLPLSVQINTIEQKITIYPNPNQGEFSIQGTQFIDKLELLDISGRLIADIILNEKNDSEAVKLVGISPGVYLVKCTHNSEVFYKKIVLN